MLEQAQTVLQTKCGLTKDRTVLVGVSGGPDSLCLMDFLYRQGYRLVVAHFNHRLRADAEDEARQVQALSDRLGLPAVMGEGDVSKYAAAHSYSVEEGARILRYQFLFDTAQQVDAQAVSVGHTADDQVETVLMHLLRGAGLSGLRGMSYRMLPTTWSKTIPLVRPLLGTWRKEVLAYVEAQGLQPTFDPTNQDRTYYRNRLRNDLIPTLETYNPQVRERLWKMAQILRDDYAIVEEVVQAAWETCKVAVYEDAILLNLLALKSLPEGIQRHLLRRAIALLRPSLRNIDFESIERGLSMLASPGSFRQTDLVAGLLMVQEGERVWISSGEAALPAVEWPQLPPGTSLSLSIPGQLRLPAGWELDAQPVDVRIAQEQARVNNDPFQAWIATDGLLTPLEVRSRLPGDRVKPLGLQGRSQKISDFMINNRLPQRARSGWPLVVSAGEVVWVPGYRLAHPFQLMPDSAGAIHLQLKRGTIKVSYPKSL